MHGTKKSYRTVGLGFTSCNSSKASAHGITKIRLPFHLIGVLPCRAQKLNNSMRAKTFKSSAWQMRHWSTRITRTVRHIGLNLHRQPFFDLLPRPSLLLAVGEDRQHAELMEVYGRSIDTALLPLIEMKDGQTGATATLHLVEKSDCLRLQQLGLVWD